MGIMDFIQKGVQELAIARPEDKKQLLVWKWPDPTIPMFSQLTVGADECAVFFRDGAVVGTLRTAGVGQRHTLSTQNLPFLSNFVDQFTGGRMFKTDLFFVNMRPMFNQKFGDDLGMIEDPQLGIAVSPRVFGSFAFEVVDAAAFIVKYTGIRQSGEDDLKWIKGLLVNSIKTVVGETMLSDGKSMLELMPLQQALAQKFIQRAPDLNAIGVRIVEMGEFKINLSEEETQELKDAQKEIGEAKRKARIAKIGISAAEAEAQQKQFQLDQDFQNQARYVQQLAGGDMSKYAAAQAMIGAGKGMATGGGGGGGMTAPMMAGAGLAMGLGMGQQLQAGMAPAPAAARPVAAAAVAVATGPVTCPSCNAQTPGGKFCQECGGSLVPKTKFCPSCGTQGAPGAKFCAGCGTGYPQ